MSKKKLAFFFRKLFVAPFKDALCSWQAVLLLFVNELVLPWVGLSIMRYLSDDQKILSHILISYSSLEG